MNIRALKDLAGMSLEFSTPAGMEGCAGKGKTRVLMEGCLERRGFRRERFRGVTRTVIDNPRVAS